MEKSINNTRNEKEYKPIPADTSDVILPKELECLKDKISANVHDVWAVNRFSEGWKYGPKKDSDKKETPLLVPYTALPESEQKYDKDTAMETLKLITKLGYTISKNDRACTASISISTSENENGEYNPTPVDTSDVILSEDLLRLIDKIAANVHDVWAVNRFSEGWKYGPKKDSDKKETPLLIPYDDLPESEQKYDKDTASETIKLIIKLGYAISKNDDFITPEICLAALKQNGWALQYVPEKA